jgi:hypothetical protein
VCMEGSAYIAMDVCTGGVYARALRVVSVFMCVRFERVCVARVWHGVWVCVVCACVCTCGHCVCCVREVCV